MSSAPVPPPSAAASIGSPPKPRDSEIDVFGLTHRGKVRRDNQDHYLVCSLYKSIRVHCTSLPSGGILDDPSDRLASFAMVADGVGGLAGGETASRAALETVASYVVNTMACYYTTDPRNEALFFNALLEAARRSHEAVVERARDDPSLQGMATTLTLGLVVWPSLYVLQVGDSRLYLLREGILTQLTKDQTWAQEMVDRGVIPPAAAGKSPFTHVLASAIGSTSAPEVGRFELARGDIGLFCTDGLSKHVSDARIKHHLAAMRSAEEACRALLEEALEGGGTDNVTLVVVKNHKLQ